MHISTKKGDSGFTSLLRGQRVSKDHLVTEALGTLDEANSHLGLARAASNTGRIKRILLQVQKHFFVMGAELSVLKGEGPPPKKTISEAEVTWLEKPIEDFEEVLQLPPGFVAFGQGKTASYIDIGRTSVRKAERIAVSMNSRDMLSNPLILKYLNRLSDLIFVLACFEERDVGQRKRISRKLFYQQFSDPVNRKWMILSGIIFLTLVTGIVLILMFHGQSVPPEPVSTHMQQMEQMHRQQ